MGDTDITDYITTAYRRSGATTVSHVRRFLLDLRVNLTDTCRVETVTRLIYSSSDMPQGLWRGFAFGPSKAEEVSHAH